MNIEHLLKPETETEIRIIRDEEFSLGVLYGKPREGHPEGLVIYHIIDVLTNVNLYSTLTNRTDLRIIALVHDSFKYKSDPSKPKLGDNHHGKLARNFSEKYINNQRVLEVIELHDEAYLAWKKQNKERARELIKRLNKNEALDLYLTFYECDNKVPGKQSFSLPWFKNLI